VTGRRSKPGLASYELDIDKRMIIDKICKSLSEEENVLLQLKLQGFTNPEIAKGISTASAIESRWRGSAKCCGRPQKSKTDRYETNDD
jgi:hypothetical protein